LDLELALPRSGSKESLWSATELDSTLASSVVPQDEWRRRERENILAALKQTGWKIRGAGGAAKLLGVKPTTLAPRMKAMGIKQP